VTNDSSNIDRLHTLIDAAMRDAMTDAQRAELESLLLTSDAALDAFVKRCQLETALHFEVRSAAAARRVDAAIAQLTTPHTIEGAADRPRRFRGWAPLMTAATLLIAVGLWFANGHLTIEADRQPKPVARLESIDGAVWLGDEYAVGHRFVEGDSIYLSQGAARISLASGVEVALRAPCFLSLDDDMFVRLAEGVVTAQVAEWAHGFTIATDTMRVVDLGTKFAVSADNRGSTETHVLDGQVRVHSPTAPVSSRQSVLLSKGEALRVQGKNKVATRLEADTERFDADLNDVAPYKPIPLFNTGRGLEEGDEDPHWRVVAGPNCPQYSGPQFAVVCNADDRYLSNDRDHSQWVSLVNPVRPGLPPNATFTYQTKFDLTGYDLRSVVISAQVIADNGVRAVRINGEEVPVESWMLNDEDQVFNRFHVIEIAKGFREGSNVIEFDVWNGIDRTDLDAPNPLALRVEWQAFGRLSVEPLVATNGDIATNGDAMKTEENTPATTVTPGANG
jgi:hypothetical protein